VYSGIEAWLLVSLTGAQWDLRTYKLLHTVPALDQCQIKFNNKGDVIFGKTVFSAAQVFCLRSFYLFI
jgi:hypothetical protein